MSDFVITLPYLEGFTTTELYTLAEAYDIDITPGQDRNMLIEEFMETVPCISLFKQELITRDECVLEVEVPRLLPPVKNPSEAPPIRELPKQFGFTYIDVLVRDPFWVYVFWEISAMDKRKIEKYNDFSSYILRVRLINCRHGNKNLVTSTIKPRDTSRYLNFPAAYSNREFCLEGCNYNECSYIVELCAVYKDSERVLAKTNPFRMPAVLPLPGEKGAEILEDPIMILSGIKDQKTLRNIGCLL